MDFLDLIVNFIRNKEVYTPIISIVLGIISYKAIKSGLKKLMREGKDAYDNKKRKTIVNLVSNVAKYIIVVIVGIIILEAYGFDTGSIITGLGVASAVIGLAFQDTLKDFIAGITIILENYYIVGDIVKYNDFVGEVSVLGLKSTKIKSISGETMTIANRNISEIVNLSQTKANLMMNLSIAYEEETSKVELAIKEIMQKIELIPNVSKNAVEYLGIDELSDSCVKYIIKVTCTQDKQWEVKRKALKIIKEELDKKQIKIPYQQIEVHNGKNI